MGMFSAFGMGKSAKGYKSAGKRFAELEQEARDTRDWMDPYGAKGFRKDQAQYLQDILTGERSIETDPGYQFTMDQGLNQVSRKMASMGYAGSSNMGVALQDRAAGLASQEYDKIIRRLMDLSGASGANAVAAGQTYGQMMTTAKQGRAEASVNRANTTGGIFAELGGGLMGAGLASSVLGGGGEEGGAGGLGSLASIAGMAAMFMSDVRLKKDRIPVGKDGPLTKYKWTWNQKANDAFGLTGEQEGYIAQDVRDVYPDAVLWIKGYLAIDIPKLEEYLGKEVA